VVNVNAVAVVSEEAILKIRFEATVIIHENIRVCMNVLEREFCSGLRVDRS